MSGRDRQGNGFQEGKPAPVTSVLLGPVLRTKGYQSIHFRDRNGQPCSLQQSSIALCDRMPGTSGFWLGIEGHRMHIDFRLARQLISVLRTWDETGTFDGQPMPRKKWVMHIIGPDELHDMPGEITALREANKLNKRVVQWREEDPSPHEPFIVALVEEQEA